jgi:hypothetical protein
VSVANRINLLIAAAGSLIVATTSLAGVVREPRLLPLSIAFTLWALLPYAVLFIAGRFASNTWMVGGAGIVALAAECGIRASVFLFPRGSTAAIALVFSPAFITVICLPAGAAGGFLVGRLWPRQHLFGRSVLALSVASLVALITLGFARPDLLPWQVLHRRAVLDRIGQPRVVAGGNAFELRTIWNRSSWFLTGRFSGERNDDLAIIESDHIELRDPEAGELRATAPLAHSMRLKWNWGTTLARIDRRLVVVRAGGGFQDTDVWELDGRMAWRYRPDPTLPPTAMTPADLDEDGRMEFYVSDTKGVARLDESGQEVWRRDKPMAHIIGVLPRSDRFGASVVSFRFPDAITVWDETGHNVIDLRITANAPVIGAMSWHGDPVVLVGGPILRALGFDGVKRFEVPLGDFTVQEALPVTISAGEPASLAIVGGAPRGIDRWRFLLLSSSREPRYESIFGAPVRLLTAKHAEGYDTLLLAGSTLQALKPR